MKSRITIEVDFDNGNPYLKVINDQFSDDVRDKLVTHFRQKLGHTSSWCSVRFNDHLLNQDDKVYFEIHPIPPHELEHHVKVMAEQARLNSDPTIAFTQMPTVR